MTDDRSRAQRALDRARGIPDPVPTPPERKIAMLQFLRDMWYGEPVRVFGLLSTIGVAYVGYADPPTWATTIVVVITAIAGFYGFRQLTEPHFTDRISQ